MGLEYFALLFNLYKIGLAVNTEHSHWFVCSILSESVCGCVSNVLLVYGTVLSIFIVCIRVCKWVYFL